GGRALSDVAATLHARSATTGADGRFALAAGCRPGLALRGARGPDYVLVHPAYGLVHFGALDADGDLALAASRGDVASQRALQSLCESPAREAWQREAIRRGCPGRPQEDAPTSRKH
ncbi:MAG: hypothetical protein DCC71_17665, partial [Proteobacteria bacterium]